MLKKEFDLFIAYHGSYEDNGPKAIATQLYEYLMDKGFNIFYFPKSGRDTYKANIIEVMKSRSFILVCNDVINKNENMKINQAKHYELSTEIDAFYALTQFGSDVSVQDSKILVCGDYSGKEGNESFLHELFANRTHFFYDTKKEDAFYDIYEWLQGRIESNKKEIVWQDNQTTSEVIEVFAKRSSMNQKCNLSQMIASSKEIKCVGISNSELTIRMDMEAMKFATDHGATVELLFLDPDGTFTEEREKEEGLRPNRIKNITNSNIESALDFKYKLTDSQKNSYCIYKYNKRPRMNIIIADEHCILQYYANSVAGMSNPCFLLEKQETNSPLYEFCLAVYEELKKEAEQIVE